MRFTFSGLHFSTSPDDHTGGMAVVCDVPEAKSYEQVAAFNGSGVLGDRIYSERMVACTNALKRVESPYAFVIATNLLVAELAKVGPGLPVSVQEALAEWMGVAGDNNSGLEGLLATSFGEKAGDLAREIVSTHLSAMKGNTDEC